MQVLSLVWGIIVLVGMFVALIPCVGWMNWGVVPLAFIGLIISIIALVTARPDESKSNSIAGLICCATAVVVGIIRLIVGFGVV